MREMTMATTAQPQVQEAPALQAVRAIAFDVQGTCVDFFQPILRMGDAEMCIRDSAKPLRGISSPLAGHSKSHHIGAARGTSRKRDSIVNIAEARVLV